MTVFRRKRGLRLRRKPLRVAVVGYDLKFIRSLVGSLGASDGMAIQTVEFGSLHAFPVGEVTDAVTWADVVVAEFCGPYVPKLGALLRPGQPMVVRMHRFEIHRGFCDRLDPEVVTRIIAVNKYYGGLLIDRTGFTADKIVVIPNSIDVPRFDKPKTSDSVHVLGLLGASTKRKRLDLALDILDSVREHRPEFSLAIKGDHPEDLKWVMDDDTERTYFEGLRARLGFMMDQGTVSWEPASANVDQWFTGVGYVLSTSDDESFHLSPSEGMASGAIPVVRSWPGAATVYDQRWLFDSPSEAGSRIVTLATDSMARADAVQAARSEIARIDLPAVASRWVDLLTTLDPR